MIDLIHELLDLVLKLLVLLLSFSVYRLDLLLFFHQLANLLVQTTGRRLQLFDSLSQRGIVLKCLGQQSFELLGTGLAATELADGRGG